jgi:hypothetical protein
MKRGALSGGRVKAEERRSHARLLLRPRFIVQLPEGLQLRLQRLTATNTHHPSE